MLLPTRILQGATLACLAAFVAILWFTLSQPWLGLGLSQDKEVVRIVSVAANGPAHQLPSGAELISISRNDGTGKITLRSLDVTEEPDQLESYSIIREFFNRQTALSSLLRADRLQLEVRTNGTVQTYQILPGHRPIRDLPSSFWVQIVTGAGALLLAAWVWAMRPQDLITRLFAFSGAMVNFAAFSAAVYSSRELAINGDVFRALSAVNHVGSIGFGLGMVPMFLLYPRQLIPARALLLVPLIFGTWLIANILHLPPDPQIGVQLPISILMLMLIIVVPVQWFLNRRDPLARAALSWLGLSVIVGAGAFVSIVTAPSLIGIEPGMKQGHAFGFFLLIYAGLAMGVSRYRLFDLSEWAFRILFYTAGTLLLLVIDLALISILHLQQAISFSIAVLAVGFLYLPVRSTLWNHFVARRKLADHELFRAVIDIALTTSPSDRSRRWHDLLQDLYQPLALEPANKSVKDVSIHKEGLELHLPAVADTPALRLHYPWRGRRLFSTTQQNLARALVRMIQYTEDSRTAYERGGNEERRRIARDLHDDVGARLLSGLYTNDIRDSHRVLREALTDIRTIVSGLATEQSTLGQMIAALRHETGERLRAAEINMSWPVEACDDSTLLLEYPVFRCIVSAHREIISNVIRHADAKHVSISIQSNSDWLSLSVSDDGIGIDGEQRETLSSGNGLRGMRRRVSELNGSIRIERNVNGGTRASLRIPLKKRLSDTKPHLTQPLDAVS